MKKILLSIVLFTAFTVNNSRAQWAACGSGLDDAANSMVVYNNELIVCNTDSAGGIAVNSLAKWDGTNWSAFGGSGPDVGGIKTMVVYNGNLVVAGYFTAMDGTHANCIASWNGTKWDSLGGGLNGNVYCMTVFNGDLIVGGNFFKAGNVSTKEVARWNGTLWSALDNGFDSPVNALAVCNSELYAGGNFHRSGADTMYYIAKWNGTDWDSLGTDAFNGEVYTLEEWNGNLYAGGDFDYDDSLNYIAYWNGTKWMACDSGLDDDVYDMAVYNGELYAGGIFDGLYDFTPENYIARWNGTSWASCGTGLNDEVSCMAAYKNKLYASGYFHEAGGASARYVAAWQVPAGSGIAEKYSGGNVSAFPNPTEGNITFDWASSLPSRLQIFNALGESVYEPLWISNKTTVDLTSLSPGIYFAEITFTDQLVRKKIVIQ